MRRWFRRQGQEDEHQEEAVETPRPEETEPDVEAAVGPPATGEARLPDTKSQANGGTGVSPVHEPDEVCGSQNCSLNATQPETAPADGEPDPEAVAVRRRGLFGRWRRGAPATAPPEANALPIDLTPEPTPETPPPPEPEMAPAIPTVPETGPAATPQESLEAEATPEILTAEDLEETGEVSAEAERRGMFRRLRERLGRTRQALSGGLDRIFRGRKVVDAALLDDLEELLITADLGVDTSLFLIQALQDKLRRRELADVARLKAALKTEMVALFTVPAPQDLSPRPRVVLMVGINGVGKTTTLAKLAHRDRQQGLTPLLVAADTFRAAAVEQLEIWGQRLDAAVVKQKTGADPAAVVFDGLAAALARDVDTVYVDTAGRLHTKVNLMEELKKIHRTAAKKIPGSPHEVLLVLDATTGQNALSQARLFNEAVGVTGLILTKMDGTAKGGVALAVVHETGIPLRYIGVGEALEDLRPFDAETFVEAILG